MKRIVSLLLLALILLSTTALAAPYTLTEEEYAIYYDVSEYLCDDWEESLYDLLLFKAKQYDMTVEELYDFMEFAAFLDPDHVWIPVNGGKKFHSSADCSNMIEPRPTTKDVAYFYGFTPCKRCNPGD